MKVVAACVLLAFAGIASSNSADAQKYRRTCMAPCVVYFGPNMHEDQFCLDYRGNGTLKVWRDNDTVCRKYSK